MKKLSREIADEIIARLQVPEVREVIEATVKALDADSGTFEVAISTENLDRYGEVIKLDGWELDHYRNNPVVLWGHDYKLLPIGMATSVEIKDGKLIAKGKFAPHEHAQEIRRLYDAGIVRATSVGFMVKDMEGNIITQAELLEFSFVSVPANPYALKLAFERELSVNELVTKGFMHVEEKEEERTVPEEQSQGEQAESAQPEEKQFDRKAVVEAIGTMKAAVSALEVLAKSEEPEGTEDGEQEAETEEQKQLREFSEKRRICQEAATIFGDVLAEARRAIEARAQ